MRYGEHVGTATQPCHVYTTKPLEAHFRLPGHTYSDLVLLPIVRVLSKDKFVLEAFWIKKYNSVKLHSLEVIENGMNLTS